MTNEIKSDSSIENEDISVSEEYEFALIQNRFFSEIDAINTCLKDILPKVMEYDINELHSQVAKASKIQKLLESKPHKEFTTEEFATIREITQDFNLSKSMKSDVITKSLFLNIFSIYDAFIGELLRLVYKKIPTLLDESGKQFQASEIFKCKSIEDFKNKIIEKEIDTIRRESYIEQFNILEKKFDIPLKKFDSWPDFVEITQRRNIAMHCDCIVSEQYLKICNENNCNIVNQIGERLEIDLKYLIKTVDIVCEVGIKLIHVIWRKLFPDELGEADNCLGDFLYALLCRGRYKQVIIFGEFAINQKRKSSQEQNLINIINYSIALKKNDQQDKVSKVLKAIDWTAIAVEFQLAKDILLDNLNNLENVIVKIGTQSKYFDKDSYLKAPLFTFIQNNESFKLGFQKVFMESFDDCVKNNVEEAIKTATWEEPIK